MEFIYDILFLNSQSHNRTQRMGISNYAYIVNLFYNIYRLMNEIESEREAARKQRKSRSEARAAKSEPSTSHYPARDPSKTIPKR